MLLHALVDGFVVEGDRLDVLGGGVFHSASLLPEPFYYMIKLVRYGLLGVTSTALTGRIIAHLLFDARHEWGPPRRAPHYYYYYKTVRLV